MSRVLPTWHVLAARAAIAIRRHRGPFPEDLTGACCVAAVLLSLTFAAHHVPHLIAAVDLRPHGGHTWVEAGRRPIDITATQFGFDAFVRLRPLRTRGVARAAPERVFEALRAAPGRRVWHPSEPRRNYKTLVPALADVLGLSRVEARARIQAAIGPEVRR